MKGFINLRFFITAAFASMIFLVFGQTNEDVINTYNKGVELANTDTKAAIEQFKLAHEMALKVGSESDDIKNLVEKQLPALQFKYAGELYKAKNIAEAVVNYELAIELAEKAGDVETAEKAKDIIPKLLFSQGNDFYKAEKYDSALICFDRSLSYDSTYAKVYLSKGVLYKKQDNSEAMIQAMDKAIEYGRLNNDEKTVTSAGNVVRDYYLINGNKAVKAGSFQQAVDLLILARKYGEPKSDIDYLSAVSYNKLSKWDEAIEAANQGLHIEEDTPEAEAKFNFELGNAFLGKGENVAACNAYKKALYGNYAESAKYQIETVLKCQ